MFEDIFSDKDDGGDGDETLFSPQKKYNDYVEILDKVSNTKSDTIQIDSNLVKSDNNQSNNH